jgi:DNA repair protein RadC
LNKARQNVAMRKFSRSSSEAAGAAIRPLMQRTHCSIVTEHLATLMDRGLDEVAQVRGIKAVRAIRLAAAYELCQRVLKEVARDS